jgi:hypothetical protein
MWHPFRRRPALDMRSTPVDNPLDWRKDGSIRPGDPAYDAFMAMMEDGKPRIWNKRPDGTWGEQVLE